MRIGQDDLIARVEQRGEDELHRSRSSDRHDNLLGIHFDAVSPPLPAGNGFSKFRQPEAVGVMSTAVSERPDACFEHCGRGIEIRLTDLHVDDPVAFVIQFLGPL